MTQTPNEQHLSTQSVSAEHIIAEQQKFALAVTGLTFWRDAILSQIPFIGDRFRSPADLQAHVNALQARYAREIEEGIKGHAANDNAEYEEEQRKAA